ncbi:gamma carbonic anhydrase family protein [Galbitalea sp. SE-J8]|uniref:gamma carbonic anhydrase family protein n=1 Tax=Galbitalea sp. SE-J8 TaxID=3054952 RepID=UPI00259CF8AE|nr:gamma carbonic anhydrase family protein [Galbitalea sp. SE-J8]MDM4762920.1 gamma carbonic anhydrase family protein [Galbitalea sp. SE-J8]
MPLIVPFGGYTPRIDPTAWVAPNATLIGNVTIEAHASVFYGAVVRGDRDAIRIGPGTNIQDNVTMHTDAGLQLEIGARVSVGHGAVLHGCSIGDDCLIGMGSTVLNGGVIGSGSLIAANALVLEYTSVPPGSLVMGVPAKALRTLTPEEQASLVENARQYAEIAQLHRAAAG